MTLNEQLAYDRMIECQIRDLIAKNHQYSLQKMYDKFIECEIDFKKEGVI